MLATCRPLNQTFPDTATSTSGTKIAATAPYHQERDLHIALALAEQHDLSGLRQLQMIDREAISNKCKARLLAKFASGERNQNC